MVTRSFFPILSSSFFKINNSEKQLCILNLSTSCKLKNKHVPNLKAFTFHKEYNLIVTNSFWIESNWHLTSICFNRYDSIIRRKQFIATVGWEIGNISLIKYAIVLSYNVKMVIKLTKKKSTDSLVTVIRSEQADYKTLGLTLPYNFVQNVKVVLLCCTTQWS